MNIEGEFTDPRCRMGMLDSYTARRSIVGAVHDVLPRFTGVLLDVGCGYMPYKDIILSPPSMVVRYIGLDLAGNEYCKPDLEWDGQTIPLPSETVDCVMATEVFEHCQKPEVVMAEIFRVLKPGGMLFLTVPFLWPIHCAPHDEYRYTSFALERHLANAGFKNISLHALGGWDACLAQMVGLYVRRRPMPAFKRKVISWMALPIVRWLALRDRPSDKFGDNTMYTGLSGTAQK